MGKFFISILPGGRAHCDKGPRFDSFFKTESKLCGASMAMHFGMLLILALGGVPALGGEQILAESAPQAGTPPASQQPPAYMLNAGAGLRTVIDSTGAEKSCKEAVTAIDAPAAEYEAALKKSGVDFPSPGNVVQPLFPVAEQLQKSAEEVRTVGTRVRNAQATCNVVCSSFGELKAGCAKHAIDPDSDVKTILERRQKTCVAAQKVPPKACVGYGNAAAGAMIESSQLKGEVGDYESFARKAESGVKSMQTEFRVCDREQVECQKLCGQVGGSAGGCEVQSKHKHRQDVAEIKDNGNKAKDQFCQIKGMNPAICTGKFMDGVTDDVLPVSATQHMPPVGSSVDRMSYGVGLQRTLTADGSMGDQPTGYVGPQVANAPAPAADQGGWVTTVRPTEAPKADLPPERAAPEPRAPAAAGTRPAAASASARPSTANDSTANMMKGLTNNPALGRMLASAAPAQQQPPAPTTALAQAQAMMTDVCAMNPTGRDCTCKLDPRRCEANAPPRAPPAAGPEVTGGGAPPATTEADLAKKRAEVAAAFHSLAGSTAVKANGESAGVGLSGYVADPKNSKDKKTAAVGGAGMPSGSGDPAGGTMGYMGKTAAGAIAHARAENRYGGGAPPAGPAADAPEPKADFQRFLPRSFGLARRRLAGVQGDGGEIAGKFENLFENVNRAYRNNGAQLSPTTSTTDVKW